MVSERDLSVLKLQVAARDRRIAELERALTAVLSAIEAAEEVGCITYTDAWENAPELWDLPIEEARAALAKGVSRNA